MPRFSPTKYKPSDDSSPGHRTDDPKRVVLTMADLFNVDSGTQRFGCPCGCGGVPQGTKAVFCMGHDARLRGKLIRAHLTGTEILYVVQGTKMPALPAMEIAEKYGKSFTEALRNAELRREGSNRQVLRNALGSDRLIKVGRWSYTGQVVAVYSTTVAEFYDIEYVSRMGERKVLKRVPAKEAPEQTTMGTT